DVLANVDPLSSSIGNHSADHLGRIDRGGVRAEERPLEGPRQWLQLACFVLGDLLKVDAVQAGSPQQLVDACQLRFVPGDDELSAAVDAKATLFTIAREALVSLTSEAGLQ